MSFILAATVTLCLLGIANLGLNCTTHFRLRLGTQPPVFSQPPTLVATYDLLHSES